MNLIPHLGSNKIRGLISKITDHLRENGCEIHYHKKMSELEVDQNNEVTGVKCSDGSTLKLIVLLCRWAQCP